MIPLERHQDEIQRNQRAWERKPLLRRVYDDFYERLATLVDLQAPGLVVELGSGIGNLKARLPGAIRTDLFPNPWLDLVCDGYELPFQDRSVSHLVLFDVFHHLRAPLAFLREAGRVLSADGRLILFEPYISWSSQLIYGLLHHEPVAWGQPIDFAGKLPRPRDYYAAQGNATRLFFRNEYQERLEGWQVFHAEAFSALSYLLSGGYSRPAFYPAAGFPLLRRVDALLSRWPGCFGARCLVGLRLKR